MSLMRCRYTPIIKRSHSQIYARFFSTPEKLGQSWLYADLLSNTVGALGPWTGVLDQAILVDLGGRKAYLLWLEIWPQEVYFLTALLILAATGLFFATALLGRVWCGFACIQTVFTDIFVMVERWLEGDRNARIKADRASMTVRKFLFKIAQNFYLGRYFCGDRFRVGGVF